MNQIINILNKVLLNRSNKTTKKPKIQHHEPIEEKNLYTILEFKNREDFDNKINQFVNREIWLLFVERFKKEIDYPATAEVVKNIICKIAKSHLGNAFVKTERTILNEKQGSKKREKAIEKAIGVLKKISPQKALEELSIIKKQAESFLESDLYQAQSKPLEGFAPSGAQLFAETLKYIGSLEKLSEVKKDELTKDFLLNYIEPLNKKYPNSQTKREDAIKILSHSDLREVFNNGIDMGILQPMASYKECKDQSDKNDQIKNKFQSITERKGLEEDLKIIELIVNAINDIKKHSGAILNCKNLQNSYIKEKEAHPLRGNDCQKMIDIYQGRIVGYQKKMYQSLNPISKLLKSMLQETRDLPDRKEFEEIMDCMQKEPNAQQIDSSLSYLANAQNKIYIQLENPSTKLRASHVNTKTELTRL
jgi:hypothetical protein